MADIFLKWAWTYGSLHVETCESLDEAVGAAKSASDEADESFDHIEHVGHGVVDPAVVKAMWEELDDEDRERPLPVATHCIELRSTRDERDWAPIRWRYSLPTELDPEVEAESLRRIYGADRVRVRRMRR